MMDVLWKFLAEFSSNFIVAVAVVTNRRSVASQVRHRLNVPDNNVWHGAPLNVSVHL
jgi:hypothetical protein